MEKDSKRESNFWSGWVHFYQAYDLCTFLYVVSFPGGSDGKDAGCIEEDLGSILGLGRSPGGGNGYPLQYSGLENSTDYAVHGLEKSRTRLQKVNDVFLLSVRST